MGESELAGPVEVRLSVPEMGWQALTLSDASTLHYCGYLFGLSWRDVGEKLVRARSRADETASLLRGLDGHFALILDGGSWGLAAVDRVRSIPLFLRRDSAGRGRLSPQATQLGHPAGDGEIDEVAALAIAMSGYSVGRRSLHRCIEQLDHGEYVVWGGAGIESRRYYRYEPWTAVNNRSDAALKSQFKDLTLALFEKVLAAADGRRIAVPLSAGLDSRLVVSALHRLGAKNVVCFSYGVPGNFDAQAGRRIAEHLGYRWHFAPFTPASLRRFWESEDCAQYWRACDTLCSIPVLHDLPAIRALTARGALDRDDVVINGNSGDYISGMHIHGDLAELPADAALSDVREATIAAMLGKHYRLWEALAGADNDSTIARALHDSLPDGPDTIEPHQFHGLYELLELQNRQAKYVINRQRVYEYAGNAWQLPLWSPDYLDFFETVPFHLKQRQRLYREALEDADWGGVWSAPRCQVQPHPSPPWMRYLALPMARALFSPLPRACRRAAEKRYLGYWLDRLGWIGVVPYRTVRRDDRGARHMVAWHTEAYLRGHGLAYDGTVIGRTG